jgi:uncharacterized protein affecting Mg2+/Co2+ transport
MVSAAEPVIQVTSPEGFEEAALAGLSQTPSSQGQPMQLEAIQEASDPFALLPKKGAGNAVRSNCGFGAVPLPLLLPKRAALRIHAVSGIDPLQHDSSIHMHRQYQYQIIMENVGAVPLQVRGRFFVISGEETVSTVGSRERPAPGVLDKSPVILPGCVLMYTSFASIDGNVGSMSGGYLVRSSSNCLLCPAMMVLDLP